MAGIRQEAAGGTDDDEQEQDALHGGLPFDEDASGLSSRGSGDESNPAAGQALDAYSDEQAPSLATSESAGTVGTVEIDKPSLSLPRARWIGKKNLAHQLSAAPELPSDPQALRQLLSDVNNPSIAGRSYGARAYEYDSCYAAPMHAAPAHAALGPSRPPYLANDLGVFGTGLTRPASASFERCYDGVLAAADDRSAMAKRKWNDGAPLAPAAVALSSWGAPSPAMFQHEAMMPLAIVHRGPPGRQPTMIAYSVDRSPVPHADGYAPLSWSLEPAPQRGYVFSSDTQFGLQRMPAEDISEQEMADAHAQAYSYAQFGQHGGVPSSFRPAAFRPSMAQQHVPTAAPVAARQSAFSATTPVATPGVRVGVSIPPGHALADRTPPIHLIQTGTPVHHALHAPAPVRAYRPEYAPMQARRPPHLVQAVPVNRAPAAADSPSTPTAQPVHVHMVMPQQWP
jgi:hypothetical protein